MKWVKRFSYFVVVAAIVAALAYAFRPQPVGVELDTVVRGPMRVTIDEEGATRIRKKFLISTPVAGRISRVELEAGDPVRAGRTEVTTLVASQPVLLDARARTEGEARVRVAEAAVGRAKATRDGAREALAFAQTQWNRYSALFEQGLVPKEQRDTAATDVRTKQAALNGAEFELRDAERTVELAQASLMQSSEDAGAASAGPITIRSPIDGVVLRRLRESEGVVPSGQPLVEIGDTSQIEIVSDLLSADAVQVGTGSRVFIEQWGGGTTLEGHVRRVEPAGFTKLSALGVEEQRVNVIIDFDDLAAARQLGDGYRVEVRIVTWETEDALKVPTGSLFRSAADWSVFTVVDGHAALRRLQIGQRNSSEAEVLSGLSEGDPVIVHPSDDVMDGMKVVVR